MGPPRLAQNTRLFSFRAGLKVHPGPAQGAGFLDADAAEHTHGDVWPQTFSLCGVQHGESLLQVA
jgi:hypothetical protein